MGIPKQQQQYTVEQLIALNPYNPDILPDLETFVNEQVRLTNFSFLFISFVFLPESPLPIGDLGFVMMLPLLSCLL